MRIRRRLKSTSLLRSWIGETYDDSKADTDSPMDEILKDADVIDHSLSDPTKAVKPHEQARYAKLCGELGFADV